MKVSGFTFIRNGVLYDYPFIEAIQSILPICDELIVVLGDSTDDTRQRLQQLSSDKIKIIESVWDDSKRVGGAILAEQTNIAFDHITGDWGFYIQGDEVIHEKYLPQIRSSMEKYLQNPEVEGLLFNYRHFYGSYDFVGTSRKWYRKEIRVVKNNKAIRSYKDAQGFRINGRKLKVKEIAAEVYHYGWVRKPESQQKKQETFHKYWHDDEWVKKNVVEASEYDYSTLEILEKFEDSHPVYMKDRIDMANWNFQYDPKSSKRSLKEKFSFLIEKLSGYRIGEYKNYQKI